MTHRLARHAAAFGLSAVLTLAVMAGLERLAAPAAPAPAGPQLALDATAVQATQLVVIHARRLRAA
ncbi:MAG: hypothetical protein KGJ24_10810 [Burkholderiales bacterium]|nr:hypothetical protein [Burkholderiales bacterium]